MSASQAREAAKNDDVASFKRIVAPKLSLAEQGKLFNTVRKALN